MTPAAPATIGCTCPEVFDDVRAGEEIHFDDGRTVILVEHVMDAIRSLCDRCVVMSSGVKIAEGTPEQALSEPEVIRAYLGEPEGADEARSGVAPGGDHA